MRQEIEGGIQATLMEWAMLMENRWPELRLLFHVPNGGTRGKAEAGRLKAQGVKAGVPDLMLPVAKGGYHGLFIEMKAGKGTLSEAQKEWLTELQLQGYAAKCCRGLDEAIRTITRYMTGKTI